MRLSPLALEDDVGEVRWERPSDDMRAVQRRLLTTLERLVTIQVSETADELNVLAQAAWGHSTVDPLPPHPITGRRILLIDGDWEMRHEAGTYLEMQGYITLQAADAPAAIASLRTALPDLVLLGMTMPEVDSITVLREIRALFSVPVIVLSVDGDEDQVVQALRLGADDCVARPFSQRELLARIESVLRRAAQAGVVPEDVLVIDEDLTIDFARNRVILHGVARTLTATEHRLLHHLVSNAGRLLPFEALLARVWGPEYREEVHYVRLYVSYLRAKIEPIPARPRYILTEKGLGYRFATLQDRRRAAQLARREPTALGQRDMQWPVSVLTTYSKALLQQPTMSDMGAGGGERLEEQATRMLDLVDALLDLQHMRSGTLRLRGEQLRPGRVGHRSDRETPGHAPGPPADHQQRGAPAGEGRSSPPRPGDRQPSGERHPVQPGRQRDHRDGPKGAERHWAWEPGGTGGQGSGHRHRGKRAPSCVRALLPGNG